MDGFFALIKPFGDRCNFFSTGEVFSSVHNKIWINWLKWESYKLFCLSVCLKTATNYLEFLFPLREPLNSVNHNWLMLAKAFLTRWLPTTSILVAIGRIYRYQFKCNLKPKTFSRIFNYIFGIYIKFQTFWKKMSLIAQVFLKFYWLQKTCLLKCIKVLFLKTLRQWTC